MVALAAYLQWQEGYFMTWALSEPKLNIWIRYNQRLFIRLCPFRKHLCFDESICHIVKTIDLFSLAYHLKGVLKKMKNMWKARSSYWLKTSSADCHGMTYFYGTTAKIKVVSPRSSYVKSYTIMKSSQRALTRMGCLICKCNQYNIAPTSSQYTRLTNVHLAKNHLNIMKRNCQIF